MDAFLTSTITVLIAEIGDKTQLLAILLAARFRKPLPIILGVLAATLVNHALAAYAGNWLAGQIAPQLLRYVIGCAFLGAAAWALIPDKADDLHVPCSARNAFLASFIAFFIAENADKTQLATVVLAAQYESYAMVLLGTTLGMLFANIPAVLMGEALTRKLPLAAIRICAAGLFAMLGIYALIC